MKYIRTKDTEFRIGEILKVLHEDEEYYECEGTFEKRMGCKAYVKKEIVVKTADSIENLIDVFVLYDADTKRYHVLEKGFYHRFDEESKKALHIANRYIYGAIWTDKGLIYVAKMNEKGELELI